MTMDKNQLDIAIIQTELHWENPELNREHFTKLIDGIGSQIDLIILPEMFTSGFSMNAAALAEDAEGPTLTWMKNKAIALSSYITGSIIFKHGHAYYNRLIWMRPDGTYIHYDKRHLFSFAGEDKAFTAGTDRVIAECFGWRIILNICYDLRFPVFMRNQDDYDCLLFVANWPSKRSSHWKTLLHARAIENLSYVIACNRVGTDDNGLTYSGDSAIIDPDGIAVTALSTKAQVILGSLHKSRLKNHRSTYPFAQDADEFVITNKGKN